MPIYHGNNQYGNSNAWWIFHFGQPNSSSILLSFCEMSPLQHTSNVINRFVLLLVLPSPDIYIHLIWQYTRNDRAMSEEMLLRDISFLLRTLSTLQCISQNYHFSSLYRLFFFLSQKGQKGQLIVYSLAFEQRDVSTSHVTQQRYKKVSCYAMPFWGFILKTRADHEYLSVWRCILTDQTLRYLDESDTFKMIR